MRTKVLAKGDLKMGLCKCPKRKVTNLFCFEHRVNVCEHCLVASHESCIVQTYLSWLTDSDFDPNCLMCSEPLSSKETVRLKCFHVFHWSCLNARANQLPNTTAPAGYKCPSCLDVIFPSPNQTSPVIEQLRAKLQTVNWARAGLGMPILPELDSKVAKSEYHVPEERLNNVTPHRERQSSFSINMDIGQNAPFETSSFTSRSKLLQDDRNAIQNHLNSFNDDDNPETKYSKRMRIGRMPRLVKRLLMLVLLILIIFAGIVIFGRHSESLEENPMFDPRANPHLRFEDAKISN
uniref:Zinc finger protein-like 1 homolog n=1 Tax=Acrobeloides nanus TaxID=290746 RepID=A0A914C0D7_9BILA